MLVFHFFAISADLCRLGGSEESDRYKGKDKLWLSRGRGRGLTVAK